MNENMDNNKTNETNKTNENTTSFENNNLNDSIEDETSYEFKEKQSETQPIVLQNNDYAEINHEKVKKNKGGMRK